MRAQWVWRVWVGQRGRLRLRSCSELLEQVIHVAEKTLLTLEAQLLHHTRETKTKIKKQKKDTVQAGRLAGSDGPTVRRSRR